jgi:hypothetical protein
LAKKGEKASNIRLEGKRKKKIKKKQKEAIISSLLGLV